MKIIQVFWDSEYPTKKLLALPTIPRFNLKPVFMNKLDECSNTTP